MTLWELFDVEELEALIEDVNLALKAAALSVVTHDYSNALYNVDHAEINLMRARNILVSIIHNGVN
jgi:hypothetical protein